ncbi:MAG: MotA/TolQ/ExbB proton channel family protein [Candidatus Kaiserbacteria bacterium]|nr:MAG: MotA/TolQ/ExbB proton channel family protein [Candidatus Kaiserbacteria bacterium]
MAATATRALRLGSLSFCYLTIAALVVAVILAYENQFLDWFLASFPDRMTFATAGALTGVILGVVFFLAFPAAGLLSEERAVIDGFERMRAGAEPVVFVRHLFGSRAVREHHSRAGSVILALKEHVETCQTLGMRPLLGTTEVVEEFGTRLEALFARLAWARTLLVSLGLFGTIVGIVMAMTAQRDMPVTPEETKQYLFLLYHGMGVVYISAVLGWGGAIWLFLFEAVLQRQADEVSADFWKLTASFIMPVIQSDAFFKAQPEPS